MAAKHATIIANNVKRFPGNFAQSLDFCSARCSLLVQRIGSELKEK
jgi:hypothetical protein